MAGRARLLLGTSVFWLGLSMLFDGVNTLVLPKHLLDVSDETTKATTLGLVTFGGLVVGLLVQPAAGALSDRLRPRWGRRGAAGVGVLLILAALAVFGTSRAVASVLLGYVLLQGAAAVAQAAQQGYIPDLVPERLRGTAAGLKGIMDLGGALLAFVLLGDLLGRGQTGAALTATAAAVVLTYVAGVALVREPLARAAAAPPAGPRLRDAFRLDLGRHRTFARAIAARFLFLLGTYAVGRFFLYFVADRLRLDASRAAEEAGGLLAGLTLVTALAAPPAGWAADRLGRRPLMVAGAALSALGVGLLPAARSPADILQFGALMAVGSAAFAGANWALTADLAPPEEAARFLGLANVGTAGAAAAAGLLGPVVDALNGASPGAGYLALFAAAAVAFGLSGLVAWSVGAPRHAGYPSEVT